jgi:uncharacterized protein YgiM (DUF1202 family)
MRPGLADAVAKEQASVAEAPAEPAPALVAAEPEATPEPVVQAIASVEPAPEPAPYVEPVRAAVDEPIFTLSSLGNELVPGEDGAAVEAASEEAPLPGESTIWYVNASSVNVRAEPSTEAEVVGKLGSGEAAMVVAPVDGDWARIIIQGDGVEGYVALRYLSPEAP